MILSFINTPIAYSSTQSKSDFIDFSTKVKG